MKEEIKEIGRFISKAQALNYVRRWNFYPTTRNESVAEHSFWVAFYSMMLILINADRAQTREEVAEILTAALFHDLEESITGDMPTLVKRYNNDWKMTTQMAMDELVGENELLSQVRNWKEWSEEPSVCAAIVKIADTVAAMMYSREQSHCQPVFKSIYDQIATGLRGYKDNAGLQTLLDALGVDAKPCAGYTQKMTHLGE